jgi:hypothetical protein
MPSESVPAPGDIRELRLRDLPGGLLAAEGRIPPLPGVYAWFRTIEFKPGAVDDQAQFVNAIRRRATHQYGVVRAGFLGPNYDVSVTPRTDPDLAMPALEGACQHPEFRAWFQTVLRAVGGFLPPLYVGKAGNLRTRLSTHLKPGSDLRLRLESAGIELDEVVIRYVIVPRRETEKGLEREIEALLSYYLVPGFTIRYG